MISNIKKRKFEEFQGADEVYENTRSKKPFLIEKENHFDGFVSGSQVINWFMDDCLVDWIKLKEKLGEKEKRIKDEDTYLADQGHLFEKGVIDYINKEIYPSVYIGDSRGWKPSLVEKTLEEMQKGTPVIYSAALINKKEKLFGTADLLVRNDYLSKLFSEVDELVDDKEIKTKFNHPYYYLVVDVKWCTLPLKQDGMSISDTKRFPGYKGQLMIYSRCLEEMQGYFPETAYLLGRRCIWSEGETNSPFVRPGIFKTNDKDIQFKTNQAIRWIRDLNYDGLGWKVSPPSRPELYPNMGSKYYLPFKKELAEEIGDLSLLYNIKTDKKKLAFSKGIYNIHDPRLSSKVLEMKGKDGKIIDKILEINKGEKGFILPQKIEGNEKGWRDERDECFVDFETFGDVLDDCKEVNNHQSKEMIFMIGMGYRSALPPKEGYIQRGRWVYKTFLIDEISPASEEKMIYQFLDFIKEKGFKRAWYYFAEKSFWKRVVSRYQIKDTSSIFEWRDVHQFIRDNEIVFKGCYTFKLKDIIKAFVKEGIFKDEGKEGCQDGFSAMLSSIRYYQQKGEEDKNRMNKVIEYNQRDVKYLYQLLRYFRDNL